MDQWLASASHHRLVDCHSGDPLLHMNITAKHSPKSTIIHARDGGKIVGTVCLYAVAADIMKLYDMYVEPRSRGKGIASQLIDQAKASARERGIRNICLIAQAELLEDQEKLIALYKRHGFFGTASVFICALDEEESDQDKMNPDSYRRKYGMCPDGWIYNEKKRRCIKIKDRDGGIPGPSLIESPAKPGPVSPGPVKENADPGYPGPAHPEPPGVHSINDKDEEEDPINERKKTPLNKDSRVPKPVNRKNQLPRVVNR